VLLAELEIRHSRAIAPTRRVALGGCWLPADPPPGFGGVLLGGVVAANVDALDDELLGDLWALLDDLETGRRIARPRLRHRFQTDVVGLDRSRHKLVGEGESLTLDLDDHGRPVPQLLGAVYATARVPPRSRPQVFSLLRRALRWHGPVGPDLIRYLTGDEAAPPSAWRAFPTDERWALQVMGFGPGVEPSAPSVQRRFRRLVWEAHPDHGATAEGAGQRMLELTEARRILLK
jgi:hypothetical protein